MNQVKLHEPVMVQEVLNFLGLSKHIKKPTNLSVDKPIYIDATLGTAGHTLEILRSGARVIGIEADLETLAIARERITSEGFSEECILVNDNFVNIEQIAHNAGYDKVSGILFDFGVNTLQLMSKKRGFSFSNPKAALDMRLSNSGPTAADLLNVLRFDQLVDLFSVILLRQEAKILASRIVDYRVNFPITRVGEFLDIVGSLGTKKTLSKGTLAMLALRIAVNSELVNIKEVLEKAYKLIDTGGSIVAISFHSGEDKLVGDYFEKISKTVSGVKNLGPFFPDKAEISKNVKARSARLRILQVNEQENKVPSKTR